MKVWEKWQHLARVGAVIDCPQMRLLAADRDPPIVVGSGTLKVSSERRYTYELRGVPADVGHALRSLRRLEADPYDGRLRERLIVVDSTGIEINAGWTMPQVAFGDLDPLWTFTGECDSLWFDDEAPAAPSTEAVFLLPRDHRCRIIFRRFFPTSSEGGGPVSHTLAVAGGEVLFTLNDLEDRLTIFAPESEAFPLTYTENWLGEPLRILFGQLAFPRLVARGTDKRNLISIRPSNRWRHESDACGLWYGHSEFIDKEGFWRTYASLLELICTARDEKGHPNFEPHTVTQFYQQVIQAAPSTRWIWALSYASAVEGMVRLIVPRGAKHPSGDPKEVKAFSKFIAGWPGKNRTLVHAARNAAARTLEISAVQALRALRDSGNVTSAEFEAWNRIRNQVMHGGLVSPYSNAEEDGMLSSLADLLHSVTRALIKQSNSAPA